MPSNFSKRTQRRWRKVYIILKENDDQPRILYLAKPLTWKVDRLCRLVQSQKIYLSYTFLGSYWKCALQKQG